VHIVWTQISLCTLGTDIANCSTCLIYQQPYHTAYSKDNSDLDIESGHQDDFYIGNYYVPINELYTIRTNEYNKPE